jgi:RNA polymerase sigma factor (sigma-70 family)
MPTEDMELVREYVAHGSESAFSTLVSRHGGLVYSAALRHTRDPHSAEEITQAVFILLARKASTLGSTTIISGWLYRTTRFVALRVRRQELRRVIRETEAHMKTIEDAPEASRDELAEILDEAMDKLRDRERDVVVLRFFENKSFKEVAMALGIEERAAQKRVTRSLEKLRGIFAMRGLATTSAALASAVSAHAVQAAPAALVKSAAAVAFAKGATANTSILNLTQGALKTMAWSKTKIAIIAGAAVLLAPVPVKYTIRLIERHAKAQLRAEMAQSVIRVKSRQRVDETTGATLIDLKPFLNTALTDSPASPKNIKANNLAQLPAGTNIYAGVPFDVEGTIQLMGNCFRKYGKVFPAKIENLPIGRTCAKIHLLHGESSIPWEQSGMPVATLILHYASGAQEEINLVAGAQAFDFWGPTGKYGLRNKPEIKPSPGTELAWIGTNPWVQKWIPNFRIRLYRTTFANPRPQESISSCDYVSDMAQNTAPFLVGLTVE